MAIERATAYPLVFPLYLAATPTEFATGLTPTVMVSKDGGAFATATNSATEPGSAGVYAVTLTATEMDADEVGVLAKAATAVDQFVVLVTDRVLNDISTTDVEIAAASVLTAYGPPTREDLDEAVLPLAKEASIAALNDVSQEEVEDAAAAALAAYPVPTKAELDAAVLPLAKDSTVAKDATVAKETTLEAVADVADAIKLRTDRIGTASAVVVAPVTTAGTLMLRQGDDYDSAHGRAVTFAVDDAAHKLKLDDTAVVVRLKATQATWTAKGVTETADGYLIVFEPTAADTRALTIPRQPYELEAKLADGDVVTLTVGTLVSEPDIPAVT